MEVDAGIAEVQPVRRDRIGHIASWIGVAICVLYGLFALGIVIAEAPSLVAGQGDRAAPPLFLFHAFTGGIVLIAGATQLRLADRLLGRRRHLHRLIGRVYVVSAWITSLGSLAVVTGFDVTPLAKIAFFLEAALWFGATSVAFLRIRARRVEEHREWMIRSFALALFFVTGGVWLDFVEGSSLYPLGVLLSWAPNLVVAELWIRRTRARRVSGGDAGTHSRVFEPVAHAADGLD